jgi:DNA-directed RNA polymerase specialized sigma24 family protein
METGDDEAAFHDFVVSRVAALSRTAYLLTGDFHLAEDLVQTALFKTAKAWHRIQGDPEAYVRRILYTQNVSW